MRAIRLLLTLSSLAIFPAQSASAAKAINGVGTDYAIFDATGVNFSPGFRNTWYVPPQHLRTSVGLYQLNPSQVATQLAAMRASGMTDIAIPIWMQDFHGQDGDGIVDWVTGEFVDYSQAALRPQQRTNLTNLVTAIKSKGFKRIIIRFAPSLNWPIPNTWDETEYQHYWNLVVDTQNLVESSLLGSQTTALYDLAMEYGGYDDGGIRPQFIKRLWGDYVSVFGAAKTVGFSYAWAPGRFSQQEQWYSQVNTARPPAYAFDIYPGNVANMSTAIQQISTEMGNQNGQPILITETWANDLNTAIGLNNTINGASAIYNTNVDGLFQWSLDKSRALANLDDDFSQQVITAQSSNTQITNYRPLLAKRRSDITNTYSGVYVLQDSTCATTTSGNCSIGEKWAAAPAGKVAVVSVKVDTGTEVLHACGAGAVSTSVNWIAPGHRYQFITRYQANCNLTNVTPNAISTVLVATTTQN